MPHPRAQEPLVTSPLLPDAVKSEQILALLRSYYEPPSNISATIFALSDELRRYDDEISRCENDFSTPPAWIHDVASERAQLQEHLSKYRSLLSPIRRMPPELLAGIFAFLKPSPFDTAIIPLFRLLHVCARWYNIVTGTPTLWDFIAIGENAAHETAMALLPLFLERSGTAPLTVYIRSRDPGAVSLLANHSERWRDAQRESYLYWKDLAFFCFNTVNRVEIFAVAPKLRDLLILGDSLAMFTIPPLDQLQSVSYCRLSTADKLTKALETTSRMLHGTTARFEFVLNSGTDSSRFVAFEPPSTTSNIGELLMQIAEHLAPAHGTLFLNNILRSLTLPHLCELSFCATKFPRNQIYWPHIGFMACVHRSSFQTTLKSLLLEQVVITEVELLACLAGLPALQCLSIGDHQTIAGFHGGGKHYGVDHHLITDSLLSKLTLSTAPVGSQSPPLIPNLRMLKCHSRLQFDDSVFLDLILSRRAEPSSDSPMFGCKVRWMAGHFREIDSAVSARLRELRVLEEAIVCFFSAELEDSED
ncbi:hypothetical protein FB45DRAFT_862325 [Roridomyces roridus]|uniref:F-box domain-containing protein n=1 Tax=Roridomyces roridus TaxID=1738132 RepID=A0AAD7C7C0_9AGAR|nr:hypothetical protein FB45DRAFT_862325 [Roridomyces roridus]